MWLVVWWPDLRMLIGRKMIRFEVSANCCDIELKCKSYAATPFWLSPQSKVAQSTYQDQTQITNKKKPTKMPHSWQNLLLLGLVPCASGWSLRQPSVLLRKYSHAAVVRDPTPIGTVSKCEGMQPRRRVALKAVQQGWGSLPEDIDGCSYWWTETDDEVRTIDCLIATVATSKDSNPTYQDCLIATVATSKDSNPRHSIQRLL
jgi:hypothetical protein